VARIYRKEFKEYKEFEEFKERSRCRNPGAKRRIGEWAKRRMGAIRSEASLTHCGSRHSLEKSQPDRNPVP